MELVTTQEQRDDLQKLVDIYGDKLPWTVSGYQSFLKMNGEHDDFAPNADYFMAAANNLPSLLFDIKALTLERTMLMHRIEEFRKKFPGIEKDDDEESAHDDMILKTTDMTKSDLIDAIARGVERAHWNIKKVYREALG